jgi:hypothetical protein
MGNADLQAEIEEIRALRRQLRIWRPSLVAALAVVILVCVLVMWNAANGLAREGTRRDQFVQQLGSRIQKDAMPLVQSAGQEALSGIDFNAEVDRLNARAPEVANASLREMRLLGRDNMTRGQKVLAEEFDKALVGREAMLKREFPDASEEQIASFLADFSRETKVQLSAYVDSVFTPHLATMNDMLDDLRVIEVTEGAVGAADVPTWEVAFLLFDIARDEFEAPGETEGTSNTPSPATTGKGTAR